MWRQGKQIPINVYEGDRPVCQCHSVLDAKDIVDAMNGKQAKDLEAKTFRKDRESIPPPVWRIHKAFQLIRDACTVSILSLEEMEAVVQRAFNGEFDSDYKGERV